MALRHLKKYIGIVLCTNLFILTSCGASRQVTNGSTNMKNEQAVNEITRIENEQVLNETTSIENGGEADNYNVILYQKEQVTTFLYESDEVIADILMDRKYNKDIEKWYNTFASMYEINYTKEEIKQRIENYYVPELFNYVCVMYKIDYHNGVPCHLLSSEDYGGILDQTKEIEITKESDNVLQVKAPCKYHIGEESIDKFIEYRIEIQEGGSYKITNISNWYYDFYYLLGHRYDFYGLEKNKMQELIVCFAAKNHNDYPMEIIYSEKGYVLNNSDKKVLVQEEVKHLTKFASYVAKNEIFARHGYMFQDPFLEIYFSQCYWYNENQAFQESDLSLIEWENVRLLESLLAE